MVFGPLDRACNAFYEPDLGSYRLVIEELLTIEAPKLLRSPSFLQGTCREASRLRRVVPAPKRRDEYGPLELWPPL